MENQSANNNHSYTQRRNNNAQQQIEGKLQPQAIELEKAVLGALMLEKDAYMRVSEMLTAESFYDPRHGLIYQAIADLGLNQRPIDMLTVIEQLRRQNQLEDVGGAVYISDLTFRVLSAAHIEEHARIIVQKHIARRLIQFSSKVQADAFDEGNDVDDLLQAAEGELFEISQTQLKREVVQIDDVLGQAMTQIQNAANRKTGLSGLSSGYTELDAMTSGWQNSDLVIIAARPAMGKTAFVLSMAKNMAVNLNTPIAMFSLEMSNLQLVNRLISNVCEIEGEKIKSGRLSNEEWDRLNTQIKFLFGAPIYIDETPGLSITELRTKARRLVREHGVRIILIDYLQLMTAKGMKFGSREQEVSTISRSLKGLAKELNIPIIALSQLNRSTETRENKRPVLSDLRESGAIEQDADIVCFIHRPEYYLKSSIDSNGEDIAGLAEFIVAKHRSGSVGDVKMRFVSKYARFENWDEAGAAVRNVAQKTFKSRIGMSAAADGASDFPASDSSMHTNPFGSVAPDLMPDSGDSEVPF